MNKRESERLAKQIEKDDPACKVEGTRHYGKGSYSLDVVDTRSGVPFVVHDADDWKERVEYWARLEQEAY